MLDSALEVLPTLFHALRGRSGRVPGLKLPRLSRALLLAPLRLPSVLTSSTLLFVFCVRPTLPNLMSDTRRGFEEGFRQLRSGACGHTLISIYSSHSIICTLVEARLASPVRSSWKQLAVLVKGRGNAWLNPLLVAPCDRAGASSEGCDDRRGSPDAPGVGTRSQRTCGRGSRILLVMLLRCWPAPGRR